MSADSSHLAVARLDAHEDPQIYEFEDFTLDPRRRVLRKAGVQIPLTAKAFELLHLLVQERDRVVTKDEIMRELWPRTVVEEGNLTQTIFVLRKALGENARNSALIITAPRAGYRFGAHVRLLRSTSLSAVTALASPTIEPASPVALLSAMAAALNALHETVGRLRSLADQLGLDFDDVDSRARVFEETYEKMRAGAAPPSPISSSGARVHFSADRVSG